MNTDNWFMARNRFFHRFMISVMVAVVSACASKPPPQPEQLPDWTVLFDRPVEFQLLVNEDLLVVGTLRHLYGLDPNSGTTLWRQRNIAVSGNDLTPVGDRPFILVNDSAGGAFDDRDTNVLALDHANGEIVWESKMLEGKILQGSLDEVEDVFFFTSVQRAHGDDRGFLSGTFGRKGIGSGFKQVPNLSAMEVGTGRVLWTREFDEKVVLRPSRSMQLDENSDWSETRPFDLGLYHPPMAVGNLVCVTYEGIHCYDANTGSPVWKQKYSVLENDLALSYANPLVDNGIIITSGDRRVRAYDLASGKQLWRSEKFDIVSELMLDGNIVYGQLGGHFFKIDSEKWKWEGEFGVVALDRASGKTLWQFEDAKDASTNVLVYEDRIWLADKNDLIALNRFDGSLLFRHSHGFKEPPVFTALNEVGQVVLVGEGEAAAFSPNMGKQVWYVEHAPPSPGAWKRFSSAFLHTTGNVLKFGSFVLSHGVGLLPSLALPIGSVDFKIINTKKIVSSSIGRSGRRMTYNSGSSETGVGNANLSGNFQYFVTQQKGSKKAVLAVLNLSTGETERMIRMDSDSPNLVIDEGNNKLYETFGERMIAMPLETSTSNYRTVAYQERHQKNP